MTTCAKRIVASILFGCLTAIHAAQDIVIQNDSDVIEVMPARTRLSDKSPAAAITNARVQISLARQNADPRHLGRAQAILSPWWDRPDAPAGIAVLQATIEQSRHEFDRARTTLLNTLQRDASQAQAWLTLATLERVTGRYPQALRACEEVKKNGASLYAAACTTEVQSLLGQWNDANRSFEQLDKQKLDNATRAWILSLQAEHFERSGQDNLANKAYQSSLQLTSDTYTALAFADFLLRTLKPGDALQALSKQVDSDAVLLRRAYAQKMLGNSRWEALRKDLRERFAALDQRGDAQRLHARELALFYLWLDADSNKAHLHAQSNLQLQKEPLDWWLAVQAAQLSGSKDVALQVRNAWLKSGLQDTRLMTLLASTKQ